nr:reverse transcriptase domain-containing protein [Tanacetum cinerariifolium]
MIMDLKLKYQTFRAKPFESLSQTYTRYKTLLSELANDGGTLSKHEINVGFINSLPMKWLSFSQGLRNANLSQTLDLVGIYERFVYKDNQIARRFPKTKKALITTPSNSSIPTAFFSNNIVQNFQENFDDEADERSSEEYLRDLDLEFHERALFSNSKHEEEEIKVQIRMALADDELFVGKNHARNGEWIDITIKKVNILLSMDEDSDWKNCLKGGILAESSQSSESSTGVSYKTCESSKKICEEFTTITLPLRLPAFSGCILLDVIFLVSWQPAWSASAKAVRAMQESFGYRRPIFMDPRRMPPKRTSTFEAPTMTQAAIRQLVVDSVATALETQAATMANAINANRNPKPREAYVARKCSYKEFMSCQPFNFKGSEGTIRLISWFEHTELVFSRSNCTEDYKVKFATGTLTEQALSLWNSFAQPNGIEESYKIT